MSMLISPERPDAPAARALIAELDAELEGLYPRESRHGFSVAQLIAQDVHFFVARDEGRPVACGGIKLYAPEYAEVKRMFVRPPYRGRSFSRAMLDHLVAHARAHRLRLVRLETGIHQTAAIRLYESSGFERRAAFGEYVEDPLSLFYEKRLDADG